MSILLVYIAVVIIGAIIAIVLVIRAERRKRRQERLECLIKALPRLSDNAICAACEKIRADVEGARLLPSPVPAVLRDPVRNNEPLCAHCAIRRSWMNDVCR